MIREEDLIFDIGRCDGGSFIRVIHAPTRVSRMVGPLAGRKAFDVTRQMKAEIEAELVSKGLNEYLVPVP